MATKSIGTLKAFLSLDPSGFLVGFAKAGAAAKKAIGGAGGIGGAITGFANSAAAKMTAVGTAAIASVVSIDAMAESFRRVDRQAKLADRLGITFESMQKLGVAADMSGADIELLAKAMLTMGQKIGSGNKALDVRFFDVADAIAKIEDPAKRAKRATEVFGKGGLELLNLLGQGSRRIKESSAIIDRFGLSLSRVDASKIEAANDSLSKLNTIRQGLQDKLAVEFAPIVESSVERMIVSLEKLTSGIKRLEGAFDSKGGLGKAMNFLDQQLFMLASFPERVADVLGLGPAAKAAASAAPGNGNRGPDIFADAIKAKPVKPAAFEFNTVEAVRAINAAGGDATGGVVTELKNILRTIQILSDDVRRETAAKDGFLIREGKI